MRKQHTGTYAMLFLWLSDYLKQHKFFFFQTIQKCCSNDLQPFTVKMKFYILRERRDELQIPTPAGTLDRGPHILSIYSLIINCTQIVQISRISINIYRYESKDVKHNINTQRYTNRCK